MKRVVFVFILFAALCFSGCKHIHQVDIAIPAEPMLIIDPGHGGEDGGAVASDGSKESELNLAIALKAEALCRFLGIESVMTRNSETLDYPESADTIRAKKQADQKARISLINSAPNGILLSIHQNLYPSASPSGSQVLYSKNENSIALAEIMQNKLTTHLDPDNRRGIAQIADSIYLMKYAKCPAVLVECGFISNPEELAMLKNDVYQQKLAAAMIASYIEFTSETGNYYG